VGYRDFWKSRFHVTPDVLDPRPETETLVSLALERPAARILDLGTGSGCILISLLLEWPEATGVGTDIYETGILVAGRNAAALGVADRIILPLSDWYDDIGGRFDLIVSNPPYIAAGEMAGLAADVRDHEPHLALTDGADGYAAYRTIVAGAPDHLTPGGRLMVEIGPTQAEVVRAFFNEAGFGEITVHPDLDGRDRVVSGTRPIA
jgi:release factor glutamine methyltransferase